MEVGGFLNNHMMQYSMYENLKTGNIIFDMMLSTIAVSALTLLGTKVKDLNNDESFNKICKICCGSRKKNEIILEGYYSVQSWNGKTKTDFPVVMDALFWYIGREKYINIINEIKLHLPNNVSSLQERDSEEDDERREDFEFKEKKLIFRPQSGCKFTIDGIDFSIGESKVENEKTTRENLLFNLRVFCTSGNKDAYEIKKWLEQVQISYESYQKRQLDKHKKVFTMIKQHEEIQWYEESFISGKSWDNLFCTNKDVIKRKLDFFVNNREWYKKRGIPWTFGVLTYGPPGCGKTSLEKVFLNYLDRHGVQLNIDENTTYKDIREVFYEPYINGKYIPLNNRVYIIPDIDAMGKVLLKRAGTSSNLLHKPLNRDDFNDKNNDSEINDSESDVDNNKEIEDTSEVSKLELHNQMLINENKMLQKQIKENAENKFNPLEFDHSGVGCLTPISRNTLLENSVLDLMKQKSGGVTLSQILNLLDGIVELDGRVLIACTNHIEKLDPALIRPGRIDCVVELGLCTHQMIRDILENFYEKKIAKEVIEKIPENKYSPCKVYEVCFRNTENMKRAISILQDTDYTSDDSL